jgi:D-sedoheptulose 7-phosphate isomerase
MTDGAAHIRSALARRREAWGAADGLADGVADLAAACVAALRAGGQVIFMGNGGSASQADHLAAELVGRYLRDDRPSLPSLALASNGALVTALGNDYGYDEIFARQVRGQARKGDVLIGLSTSGRSANVAAALAEGRTRGCVTALWTGDREAEELPAADHLLRAPSRETPVIQEVHLACGHLLCELIELAFIGESR